jgi:adenosylcobinamide-GDP ribazoletransferase
MQHFLAALRFLTILPVPGAQRLDGASAPASSATDDSNSLTTSDSTMLAVSDSTVLTTDSSTELTTGWGRATAWYPAVGLVLGIILAVLDWGLRWLFPDGVASALLLAAWVVLTGALHLDGFIDCCDGLLAPVPRARRLEILRDVHAGAFGIVGIVLLLLTKYAALVALPGGIRLPALLLVPTLARLCMTGAVHLYPYARAGSGLGQKAKTGAGHAQLAIAVATTLLACALAALAGLGWTVLPLILVTVASSFLIAQWIQSRLGGLTGDAYGAVCELAEVLSLLVLLALAYRGVLP